MTGMGSVAGDFCSHIEMGSPKVYVICRVVKMGWRPALSPATLRLLPPVTWETHIPSAMCSPTWEPHIPPGKHISLVNSDLFPYLENTYP